MPVSKVNEQTLSKKAYQELLNSHKTFTDVLVLNYMNIEQTCTNNISILKERSRGIINSIKFGIRLELTVVKFELKLPFSES